MRCCKCPDDIKNIDMDPTITHNHRLEQLHRWLNFELPGAILFALSFFYTATFYLFLVAAVVFTPFMLKVLFEERRFGWIVTFFLFVVLPGVLLYEMPPPMGAMLRNPNVLWSTLPIGLYVCYCFLLKLSIPGMMDE